MSSKEIAVAPEKSLQEKCGILGIYRPGSSVVQQFDAGVKGSRAQWHRGQHGLGYVINTNLGPEKCIRTGTVDQALPEDLRKDYSIRRAKSNWALFHTRYGTSGRYKEENLQPITVRTPDGINFSVIHNGEFAITRKIRRDIPEKILRGASDTIIFAKTLQYAPGSTPEEKIIETFKKINGAYSMLIGTDNALFAARDQFGIRPMILGKCQDGWIIASETHALDKLGIKPEREIKRGEIIKIDEKGITTLKEGLGTPGNFCDLEWAYFSRPDSLNPTYNEPDDSIHPERWLSNLIFRENCGLILAKEKPIKNATIVVGVPDSGVAVSTGYANGMHLPYRQVLLRDHYDQNGQFRAFMQDQCKEDIPGIVCGKLSSVADQRIWKDAIVVVGDDSMIRGLTSIPITKMLFNFGAKEVHWVLGFPPVRSPCHLGVSLRTDDELIAHRNHGDEKAIAREIGATSVNYISNEGFIKARTEFGKIYLPEDPKEIFLRNGGCGGCITGLYPISKEGVVYQPKS